MLLETVEAPMHVLLLPCELRSILDKDCSRAHTESHAHPRYGSTIQNIECSSCDSNFPLSDCYGGHAPGDMKPGEPRNQPNLDTPNVTPRVGL